MDNQAYFDGDFWQCVQDAAPGEAPDSAPAKWRRIRIPAEFRQVLKKLTHANLLELDGQTDKANLHRSAGESLLEDLVREAANQEHTRHSGSVKSLQGQTVKASVILDDAYGLMRWDQDELEDRQKQDGRRSLSGALQQIWEAWWWGSLMVLEQTALRDVYADAAFYPQGSEVYFPPTKKYYLAIQPAMAIAPATLTTGSYVLNGGFWAESKNCYTAAEVDNTLVYEWGAQVRNPLDGLFYQRGGSLNVTGTNADFANQIYQVHPSVNFGGRVMYWPANANNPNYAQYSRFQANVPWVFSVVDNTPAIIATYFGNTTPTPITPDLETVWMVDSPGIPGELPGPSFSRSFVAPAPGNAGHWGQLLPFDHVLTSGRKVRSVSRQNPRVSHNPEAYHLEPVDGGVCVRDWTCGTAWVWSRRVTPIIDGDDYDNTATYEATPENEIVFDA